MEAAIEKPLFIIDTDPVVEWPVIVKLPIAGGTFADFQFEIAMKVLSPDEYEQLSKDAPVSAPAKANEGVLFVSDEEAVPPTISALPMSEILLRNIPKFQRVIVGWDGVKDRDGNAVAYTPEKLAEQITGPRGPALSTGLWRAINEVRYGMRLSDGTQKEGARLGN